jgi:hypothetical protein
MPTSDELAIAAVAAGRTAVATAAVSTFIVMQTHVLTHLMPRLLMQGLLSCADDEPTLWTKKFPLVLTFLGVNFDITLCFY